MNDLAIRHRSRLLLVVACLTLGALTATAPTSATGPGTGVDSSGGVLPGVTLSLRNTATGLVRTTITGTEGRFVFAGLPASEYELGAELSGFRRLLRQGLRVT